MARGHQNEKPSQVFRGPDFNWLVAMALGLVVGICSRGHLILVRFSTSNPNSPRYLQWWFSCTEHNKGADGCPGGYPPPLSMSTAVSGWLPLVEDPPRPIHTSEDDNFRNQDQPNARTQRPRAQCQCPDHTTGGSGAIASAKCGRGAPHCQNCCKQLPKPDPSWVCTFASHRLSNEKADLDPVFFSDEHESMARQAAIAAGGSGRITNSRRAAPKNRNPAIPSAPAPARASAPAPARATSPAPAESSRQAAQRGNHFPDQRPRSEMDPIRPNRPLMTGFNNKTTAKRTPAPAKRVTFIIFGPNEVDPVIIAASSNVVIGSPFHVADEELLQAELNSHNSAGEIAQWQIYDNHRRHFIIRNLSDPIIPTSTDVVFKTRKTVIANPSFSIHNGYIGNQQHPTSPPSPETPPPSDVAKGKKRAPPTPSSSSPAFARRPAFQRPVVPPSAKDLLNFLPPHPSLIAPPTRSLLPAAHISNDKDKGKGKGKQRATEYTCSERDRSGQSAESWHDQIMREVSVDLPDIDDPESRQRYEDAQARAVMAISRREYEATQMQGPAPAGPSRKPPRVIELSSSPPAPLVDSDILMLSPPPPTSKPPRSKVPPKVIELSPSPPPASVKPPQAFSKPKPAPPEVDRNHKWPADYPLVPVLYYLQDLYDRETSRGKPRANTTDGRDMGRAAHFAQFWQCPYLSTNVATALNLFSAAMAEETTKQETEAPMDVIKAWALAEVLADPDVTFKAFRNKYRHHNQKHQKH